MTKESVSPDRPRADIRHYKFCRICDSPAVDTVIELTATPPADMFLPEPIKNTSNTRYPLDVGICQECSYLQLRSVLSPEKLYPEFSYLTATTVGLVDHYEEYVNALLSLGVIRSKSLVVDIGSNDGSFLKAFGSHRARLLGIEPSKEVAKLANLDVPTICEFFDGSLVSKIVSDEGKASLVTANYMYANVENVLDFTHNVCCLLEEDGLFVVQTGYHPDQMKRFMFDYIYHEHLSYFSVYVLKNIFERCGLELIHVERNNMKGGSIRVVGQKIGGSRNRDKSVAEFLSEETSQKIHSKEIYQEYSAIIKTKGLKLRQLLSSLLAEGKRVVGYGASHSTTTLMYHFELGNYLDYLIDDNELKHSCVSPGLHLPVFPTKKIYDDSPDYVLILAWQHGSTILERNKCFLKTGGKFILPLPIPHIL